MGDISNVVCVGRWWWWCGGEWRIGIGRYVEGGGGLNAGSW
ncbi:unnamed protein product [Tuber melanosporum]|uniref:(Perigord truffle) hypothetical protein n=1 Tax=Tuber melanosporum (strain Mel28) TaxID=656061 RepID=D5GPA6_TUBMM|nr:uncharacterized protein GSTUM_00011777001 [Tuber melanosporum]CAZ86371.1 unnamed protein product [Tuber melanosporum]